MDHFKQDLIHSPNIPRLIRYRRYSRPNADDAASLISTFSARTLGVGLQLSSAGCLVSVAFSTSKEAVIIFTEADTHNLRPNSRDLSFKALLRGSYGTLMGFEMDKVVIHLAKSSHYHVRGVDLSTILSQKSKKPWQPSKLVEKIISPNRQSGNIDKLWDSGGDWRDVCLRAWIAASVADTCTFDLRKTENVDTSHLKPAEIECLSTFMWQQELVKRAQPKVSDNEFSHVESLNYSDVRLRNARYSNRVRRSDQRSVEMTMSDGSKISGRAVKATGKTTIITIESGQFTGTVTGVRVLGRPDITNPELARRKFVLSVLSGEETLQASPFIQLMWFPYNSNPTATRVERSAIIPPSVSHLNQSQMQVVRAMLSECEPVVVAHGPPGTGKTMTISSAVQIWNSQQRSAWICAQSNAAVKNIADCLHRREIDFKLIVSNEFYFEWHEHIYNFVRCKLIRSDEILPKKTVLEKLLSGSRIILCTLSMLSNPILETSGLFDLVPVERLVIDEASQIEIGNFMHLFHKCKKLVKVCFFGDPKQLPPFNQDKVETLQSIFDLKHLQINAYFLNIQYRMPIPLGDFISREVYDGKLHSKHSISDFSCISFIDVSDGEEEPGGHSWKNIAEVRTVARLVRLYYQYEKFCVITPYDAQRSAIEKQLKSEFLPWQHVFSVDSFQGHEADYVLISLTRTKRLGFLQSLHRMNVMLSRCRCGVVIITNKEFIRQPASQHTLLAKLSQHVEKRLGKLSWISWRDVAEHKANLPGTSGSTHDLSNVLSPLTDMKLPTSISNIGASARLDVPPSLSSFPPFLVPAPAPYHPSGRWSSSQDVAAVKAGLTDVAPSVDVQYSQSSMEIHGRRPAPRKPPVDTDDGSDKLSTEYFPALCQPMTPISAISPSMRPRALNPTKWSVPLQIKQPDPSHVQSINEVPLVPTTKDDFPSLNSASPRVSPTVGAWASPSRILTQALPSKPSVLSSGSTEVIGFQRRTGVYREQTSLSSSGLSADVDPFPALCDTMAPKAIVDGDWASAIKMPRVKNAAIRQVVVPSVKKQRQTMSNVSLAEEGFPFLRRFS